MRFRRLVVTVRRLILFMVPAVLAAGPTAAAPESLYVARVAVDVRAQDAVAARAKGMAEAERRATDILMKRIVPLSVQPHLPEFSREEIQDIVVGIAVRKERMSNTRYVASLDVQFREYAVKQLLADHAIPIAEERAASISILPVMVSGEAMSDGRRAGWRAAWERLDLSHSVTPATLVTPRSNLSAATVKGALAGDADALATLRNAYGYGGLVIAVADVWEGRLRVRLAGEDAVGAVSFEKTYRPAAQSVAAADAFANLETRWKSMQERGMLPVR